MHYDQDFFPYPTVCKFFPAGFKGELVLPANASLDRRGSLLGLIYNYKRYTLAITEDGILAGYLGKISPSKRAAITIVVTAPNTAELFEARFTTSRDLATKFTPEDDADGTDDETEAPTAYQPLPIGGVESFLELPNAFAIASGQPPIETPPTYGDLWT